jgi:hypothetical protein
LIVCHKPVRLYDVDLTGLAIIAALGALAWWFVVAPWQTTWHAYHELAARHAATQAGLENDLAELGRFEQGLAELRRTIVSETEAVPSDASTSRRLLRNMTDIARDAGIEILSVAPKPSAYEGDYLVTDIQVMGRGRSMDFIRFLDQLAGANPYQSLQSCSISRATGSSDAECRLSWSVRLYLLPAQPGRTDGESS